ncbi:DUF6297 family protein [Herbidospora mongoliensis]|uniref:DUF6297 family protein n=1 Tax=Herbidospora mongoliensis TaxID=688067 RepID=UPI00083348AB|nr:DUF6297 family protein [Herbidospora mongoliensis]
MTRFSLAALAERAVYLVVLGAIGAEAVASGLSGGSAPPIAEGVAAALTALCLVLLAKGLLGFGPLYAGAPARTWVLSTPADRGRLLRKHLAGAVAAGVGGCLCLGFAFVAVTRLTVAVAPWFAVWAAVGVVVACACVLIQSRYGSVPLVQRGLAVTAWLLAGTAMVADSGLDLVVPVPVALTCAVAAVWLARQRLGTMTRGRLSSGAELATATQASALSLDVTLFWTIVLERRARSLGRVRPAAIHGTRFTALIRADLARIRRTPTALLFWAALLAVPYGAAVTPFLPAIHVVAGFVAVDRLAAGLRVVSRAPALRRALGGSDRELALAHLAIPGVGAVVWSLVTLLVVPGVTPLMAAITTFGALAVVYRVATRPPLDYPTPVIDVGLFGPTPLGLILQLSRGPALLAGLALVQTAVG